VGAKGRSVLLNLMQGLRAGGPFATLTLIGVMFIVPSAAAAVAMEGNCEGMVGAGPFNSAQQLNSTMGSNLDGMNGAVRSSILWLKPA